jgi:CheY-like chemotaxis protein
VIDSGIGILKDRLEEIFERFIQADIQDNMALQGGAGLGLSISKAYVEMLDGKIWVDSKVEKGSTFYFTIPYNETFKNEIDCKNIDVGDDSLTLNLKILIAEDDEISSELMTIIADKFAEEIIYAKTGRESIEACQNNPDIDLILMDIQMPDLNGYEASRQIRQFNKEVVIIAQTAYSLSGDREKTLASGCNDYISKPIN